MSKPDVHMITVSPYGLKATTLTGLLQKSSEVLRILHTDQGKASRELLACKTICAPVLAELMS